MEAVQALAGPSSRPDLSTPLQCTICRAMSPVATFRNNPDMINPRRCLACAYPDQMQDRWREMMRRMVLDPYFETRPELTRESGKIKKARSKQTKSSRQPHGTSRSANSILSAVSLVLPGSMEAASMEMTREGDKVPLELGMLKEPLRSAIWLKMFYRSAEGHNTPQGHLYQRYVASLSHYPSNDPRYRQSALGKIPIPMGGVDFIHNVQVVMPQVTLSRAGYLCVGLEARPFEESKALWDKIYLTTTREQLQRQSEIEEIKRSGLSTTTVPMGHLPSGGPGWSARSDGMSNPAQMEESQPIRQSRPSHPVAPVTTGSSETVTLLAAPPLIPVPPIELPGLPLGPYPPMAQVTSIPPAVTPAVLAPQINSMPQIPNSQRAGPKSIDLSVGTQFGLPQTESGRPWDHNDPFSLQPPGLF